MRQLGAEGRLEGGGTQPKTIGDCLPREPGPPAPRKAIVAESVSQPLASVFAVSLSGRSGFAALAPKLMPAQTPVTAKYDPTRRFYRKYGYDQPATIPDFYADGDGMVVFSKRLARPAE